MNELLLGLADDELVLGWRDSEWTGIAPLLEEDVAFSSIAQNEIGHARAVYQLLADDADALAFDRPLAEYRCAPLVELRLLDWAHAIARRWLYEEADRIRIEALMQDARSCGRGPRGEDRPRGGVPPHARGALARAAARRAALRRRGRGAVAVRARRAAAGTARGARARASASTRSHAVERGTHTDELAELWNEMTIRSPLGAGGRAVVTADEVWAAFAEIPDPEIPVISLVDLGVIRSVDVHDGHVRVELTPTFLGCPALEAMTRALEEKVDRARRRRRRCR